MNGKGKSSFVVLIGALFISAGIIAAYFTVTHPTSYWDGIGIVVVIILFLIGGYILKP